MAAFGRCGRLSKQHAMLPPAKPNGGQSRSRQASSIWLGSSAGRAMPRRCPMAMPDALPNSAVLDQGGACGAAGPAPAPGSASGRPPGASRATAIETLIKTTHPSRRQVARTAAVSASDYLASAVMGDVTGGSPEAVTARRRQTCGPGAASPSRRIAGQGVRPGIITGATRLRAGRS